MCMQGAIVQTLINRFKEFRRNKKDRSPLNFAISSRSPSQDIQNKRPGESVAIPDIPEGEDDTSFERHNKAIKMECSKKGKRNMAVIKELVTVSFAMRRRDIRDSSCHVKDILVKYPFFKMLNLVS